MYFLILRKFCEKITLKHPALPNIMKLLLMISLSKKRETGVKSVMKRVSDCKINEMALWKGESCDKMFYETSCKFVYSNE